MRAGHLTPDELEALARGEETESQVLKHLGVCAPCREAAREGMFATRYVRALASDHPDEHVLTALWSNALSPARKEEVERHVATCSRCRALLDRLVRATPAETSPPLVGHGWLDETRAWAAASTSPRRATLVVRKADSSGPLQAAFESITESLRRVALKPPALGDGKHSFRFKPYREGAAARLAVTCVQMHPLAAATAIGVTLTSASSPPQHAEFRAGVEASFELSPGTSVLSLELGPRWEIEIRFDA